MIIWQIVLSILVVLLPAAQIVRDWKFADRRTLVHHRITILILATTMACGVLTAWITWLNYKSSEDTSRKIGSIYDAALLETDYTLFMNGYKLATNATIDLVCTNGLYSIRFDVKNIGKATARNLEIFLNMPSFIGPVKSSDDWFQGHLMTETNGRYNQVNGLLFCARAQQELHPGVSLTFGEVKIERPASIPTTSPLFIVDLQSANSQRKRYFVTCQLK